MNVSHTVREVNPAYSYVRSNNQVYEIHYKFLMHARSNSEEVANDRTYDSFLRTPSYKNVFCRSSRGGNSQSVDDLVDLAECRKLAACSQHLAFINGFSQHKAGRPGLDINRQTGGWTLQHSTAQIEKRTEERKEGSRH